MASDILIVDDEADIRELIAGILEDEGYQTRLARGSDSALAVIAERLPSLVVLDIWLQGSRLDGLELLKVIQEAHPDLPVVIISGHGNIETAVTAIKQGAYDYVEKPFNTDRLLLIVSRALEKTRLLRENEHLKRHAGFEDRLIGSSVVMNQLRQTIQRLAQANSRVLISGSPGTGKELAARAIHQSSPRSGGPFVALNAATMAPERVEVELFGVEEGDGRSRKIGALEQAHMGTLYLDEVADMPIETQGKILRVLVEQSFVRIGGDSKVKVDVRVLSSTSRNLEAEIAADRFRDDLFHRLAVVPVKLPSLAERREDIPEIIEHFMLHITDTSGLQARTIGEDAMAVLQAHDWPGNVRQLRNNIERLMILAGAEDDAVITADMLPNEIGSTAPPVVNSEGGEQLMALPLREARELFERQYLMAQINRFGGNISKTAGFIGMERSALHRKLKSLGLGPSDRSGAD